MGPNATGKQPEAAAARASVQLSESGARPALSLPTQRFPGLVSKTHSVRKRRSVAQKTKGDPSSSRLSR